MSSSERERLVEGARRMGVPLGEPDAERLLRLLDELARWNRTHNLTAITKREDMITHHLLDSLSIHGDLRGRRIADVGTGAGFPGLPLAVVSPDKHFTLIDSNAKKVRFVGHAARTLGLSNVEPVHGRAESIRPDQPFDTVVARAFAPLPVLLERVASLCGPHTRVLAMKGRRPEGEIASMPAGWRLTELRDLEVPGLGEARCLLTLEREMPESPA